MKKAVQKMCAAFKKRRLALLKGRWRVCRELHYRDPELW